MPSERDDVISSEADFGAFLAEHTEEMATSEMATSAGPVS